MPHLASFSARHPDINIELIPSYTVADLARREADIVIRFMEHPGDNLVGRRLPDFADAAYATPAYVDTHRFDGPDPTACWIEPISRDSPNSDELTIFSSRAVKAGSTWMQAARSSVVALSSRVSSSTSSATFGSEGRLLAF